VLASTLLAVCGSAARVFTQTRALLSVENFTINSQHKNYGRFATGKTCKRKAGRQDRSFFFFFQQGSANSDLAQRRPATVRMVEKTEG